MLRAQLVVAVRHDEHDAHALQPASDEFDQIERRLVRPMHVLENEDRRRRSARQLIDRCVEDGIAVGRRCDGRAKFLPRLPGDVIKRRQRMRRK